MNGYRRLRHRLMGPPELLGAEAQAGMTTAEYAVGTLADVRNILPVLIRPAARSSGLVSR